MRLINSVLQSPKSLIRLTRGSTREKALVSIIDAFNSKIQHEFVENKFATLLHQCISSIKKGSAKEIALASHVIGLLALTTGPGERAQEILEESFSPIIEALKSKSDASKISAVVATTVYSLLVVAFYALFAPLHGGRVWEYSLIGTYSAVALIIGIIEGESWFYNCCPRCARKVRAVDDSYYCDNCAKETNDFKPRYKLIVRVQDKSGMTTFTLFNKEAEQLIGFPVENIISGLPKDSSITAIPPILKNIIGKKCAFDMKINAYNTERGYEEFTVYRVKESEPPMKQAEDNQVDATAKKKQKINSSEN